MTAKRKPEQCPPAVSGILRIGPKPYLFAFWVSETLSAFKPENAILRSTMYNSLAVR